MQDKRDVETKKPELQDFGITPEQYNLYKGRETDGVWLLAFALVVGWLVYISLAIWLTVRYEVYGVPVILGAVILACIVPFMIAFLVYGIAWLIQWPAVQFKKHRMLKSPIVSRIKLYEEAETAYQVAQEEAERQRLETEIVRQEAERQQREARRARQAALKAQRRKQQQYWESLGGIPFERELGKLFRTQGYNVKSTPVSGDQGVDLILTKNGKTTVVQCKAHKSPVGASVVRDLFGSMHHFKADSAILACTGGVH